MKLTKPQQVIISDIKCYGKMKVNPARFVKNYKICMRLVEMGILTYEIIDGDFWFDLV